MVSYIWWIALTVILNFLSCKSHNSISTGSVSGELLISFVWNTFVWLFSFTLAVEVYTLDKTGMFPSPYKQATHKRRSALLKILGTSTTSFLPQEESGNRGFCLLTQYCARREDHWHLSEWFPLMGLDCSQLIRAPKLVRCHFWGQPQISRKLDARFASFLHHGLARRWVFSFACLFWAKGGSITATSPSYYLHSLLSA